MRTLAADLVRSFPVSSPVVQARRASGLRVVAATSTTSPLIAPVKVGDKQLKHRVVLSPMTRLRCEPGTEAFREINELYYEQRSSPGGLIITECICVGPDSRGYVRAPGLYKPEQVTAFKRLVDKVHAKGSVIYAQLFHPGRVSHSSLLPPGAHPISTAAIPMTGQLYVDGGKKVDYEIPKAASAADLNKVVKDFAATAKVAVENGADGVEIHAGNGYLLQQFLSKKLGGQRTDGYGGASIANRSRLLLEVVDAIAAEIGASTTGIKLQPGITFSDLIEPEEDVKEFLDLIGPELSKRNLAYVCLSSLNAPPYSTNLGLPRANVSFDVFKYFRPLYKGVLMVNGGLSIATGEAYAADGTAHLVSYGVPFIANANLPALIAAGVKDEGLNPGGWNTKVWYAKDPKDDPVGYIDWPLAQV